MKKAMHADRQGKLIVFEGISGTGKETQAKILKEFLAKKGIASTIVYHPSPELKEVLSKWRKERNIDNVSEAYFLLADRFNRVKEVIIPALNRGEWVICLRNWLSALIYQAKSDKDRTWITKEFARFEPKPDYLFYFDISPELALQRINKRNRETGEPLGKFETIEILKEKHAKYFSVFQNFSHVAIDASESVITINHVITSYINI